MERARKKIMGYVKKVRKVEEVRTKAYSSVAARIISKHRGLHYRWLNRSPLAAIRLKCLDCVGGQSLEVKRCSIKECFLHPYRFGKKPK